MKLTWLEDFLALAETGNFSRAADRRAMTQPAFSRRIQALESWIGVPLFDRASQPVTLTEAGGWFRTTAQEILARVGRVPEEARGVAGGSAATLRFAATHALSLTFLPTWLRSLESNAALGPIQLISDVAAHCEALMRDRRVQFMLCHAHSLAPPRLDAAAYPSVRVGTDALLPVAAAGRDGQARYQLGKAAARRLPLLAYSAESGLGRVLRAVHGTALERLRVEPVFTAHLATLLKAMALEGRGIAWLPRSLIEEEIAAGRLVEAGPQRWRIGIEIRLFRRAGAEAPAAEAFWKAAGDAGRRRR